MYASHTVSEIFSVR